MQWLNRMQRRAFGRCEHCAKGFGGQTPHILGYGWNGWLASEDGLYHAPCLEKYLQAELRLVRPRNGYGEPMQLRGV